MYTIFLLSIVAFTILVLITFVIAFRNCRWTLIVSIPIIIFVGGLSLYSHQSMLGYPVNKKWEDLPTKWTVIFFQSRKGSGITLWLMEGNTTRLIKLPWIQQAENALQGERSKMGKGVPVTFGIGESKNKGKAKENGGQSWKYKVQSYGKPIIGRLPPKE